MTALKESYHQNMTLVEAEKLLLKTLKEVMEDKCTADGVEMLVIKTDTKKIEYRNEEYIAAILSQFS
jgi:20S proteasome alpha/beta subunit